MTSRDDHHRVYVSFQFRNGWHCQFLEADLKTSLPKRLHFASPDKVIELVQRGGGIADQEGQADAESGHRDGKRRSIPQSDARAILKAEALSSRSICMTVPSSGSNPVCSLLSRVCRPFWATIHIYSPIQHSYLARSRTDHPAQRPLHSYGMERSPSASSNARGRPWRSSRSTPRSSTATSRGAAQTIRHKDLSIPMEWRDRRVRARTLGAALGDRKSCEESKEQASAQTRV